VAEVYVQPAADGGEKTAAAPPPAPTDRGAAKDKAGAEGGGAVK
jgi:hypothetical protein